MAPRAANSRRPTTPVHRTAATAPPRDWILFALAIIHSTPAGSTAQDYARILRDRLRHQRRHTDLVERLQQEVSELQRQKSELQQQNRELQSSIIDLERASWYSVYDDTTTAASNPKKRKKAASPRKSRLSQQVINVEEPFDEDLGLFERSGLEGRVLMEQIWMFQKLAREPDADPEMVASRLIELPRSIGRVMQKIAKSYDKLATRTLERPNLPTLADDKSEFSCAIGGLSRAFWMVLHGLESLNDDSPGQRLPGLVIFECVSMFSVALDAIEASAHQAAVTAMKKNTQSKSGALQESVAARGISQWLRHLIGVLDKNKDLHHKLFDGFTFVLFERVGKRLYYTVFGRNRNAAIEDDIAPLPTDPEAVAERDTESLAIRLEVKALVLILEKVMDRAPDNMNPQTAKTTAKTNSVARTLSLKTLRASRTRLSTIAQDRLQRTLVACMFGDTVDDPFKDILTQPVSLGPWPSYPKITDRSVEEWYQNKVWELVGWDIMARETEWMGDGGNKRGK